MNMQSKDTHTLLTKKQEDFCQAYIKTNDVYLALSDAKYNVSSNYGDKYYVYLLINPITNEIFYIGKGKGKRAEDHLKENKKGIISNVNKHRVINEIIKNGFSYEIVLFETDLEENKALMIEKEMIKALKSLITNKSKGFLSKHDANQEKAKIILRNIIPYEDWIAKRKRKEFDKNIYLDCIQLLEKVAKGDEKLYDTFIVKEVNGEQKLLAY